MVKSQELFPFQMAEIYAAKWDDAPVRNKGFIAGLIFWETDGQ